MTITSNILSGDRVSTPAPANIPCLVGCCSLGTVGSEYAFDPGDDVSATLGGGQLADAVYFLLAATGRRVLAVPATPTWGALPAVVHVGAGPTVTAALTGAGGPLDDHTILGTIKSGGINGVATMDIAYDGVTAAETIVIPIEPPAVLRGTVDLNAQTYPWSALNSQHLDFTAPASKVLTFASAPTSPQDVIDDFNALAVAAPLAARARLAEDTAGHAYFELYSTSGGAAVTMTMDLTASTADATLGLATASTTGAAATLALPFTNLTLTFPAGTYVRLDTYKLSCVGPRPSISAVAAAALVAHDNYKLKPFGFMVDVHFTDTAQNAALLQSSLSTTINGWRQDNSAPIYFVVGSPAHVASSTLATNETNIATADQALLAAFSGNAAALDSVAAGDCYIDGSVSLRAGRFRRSAAVAWAVKRATASKLGSDVAEGIVPGVSLLSPDLLTRARNELSATTKLGPQAGGNSGPGFAVLKATSAGLGSPKFCAGVTRAGGLSRLRFSHSVAVACVIQSIVFGIVEGWEGETWPTDPSTGRILDSEKAHREDTVRAALEFVLTPEGQDPNVSAFQVTIDNSGKFIDTGSVPVKTTYIPLGLVLDVSITTTAQGTITQG